jgi:hypothetical protein
MNYEHAYDVPAYDSQSTYDSPSIGGVSGAPTKKSRFTQVELGFTKAIPDMAFGQDVAGIGWIVLDFLTELAYEHT